MTITTYWNAFTSIETKPQKWQTKLHQGDYFVIDDRIGNTILYGRLESRPNEKGMFQTALFSAQATQGNSTSICIVEPTRKISEYEFEKAKKQGWTKKQGALA